MCKSWLLVFSLLFFSCIHASDDPRVEYLGIEKGLSNNTVTSIFQDHHGFMWIGTYDGLNKYDGYSFRVFVISSAIAVPFAVIIFTPWMVMPATTSGSVA